MNSKFNIFKGLGIGTMCLAGSIFFAGCDATKLDKTQFRVEEGYIQWSKDGENWIDIISIEDINETLDDSINEKIKREVENKIEENNKNNAETDNNSPSTDGKSNEQEINNEPQETNDNNQPSQTENNKEESLKSLVISYNYGEYANFFVDAKSSETIGYADRILNLPVTKSEFKSGFAGWFIQGTDIEVKKNYILYDDITLEAKFNYLPSGLYQDGKYVMTWADIISKYPYAFEYGKIVHTSTEGMFGLRKSISYLTSLSGTLVVDNSIYTIGDYAFSCCKNLNKIVLPDSVVEIDTFAFNECSSLKEITLSSNLKSISSCAFNKCTSLKDVVIPNGVEKIGYLAFCNCGSIRSIVIPTSVKEISSGVFEYVEPNQKVYYEGSKFNYSNIYVSDSNNDVFKAENVYFFSEKEPTSQGHFWHYLEDGKTIVEW